MHHSRTPITLIAACALAVLICCSPAAQAQSVLYDNGPLITHSDNCSDDDASRLQTDLGMNTLGFGNQLLLGNRMADDFTVPSEGWDIDSITFFAYQTGASSDNSTITGLYVQIWDGPPDDNESSVIWGDLTTNVLSESIFTGIQRDSFTDPCAGNRYVFANAAIVDVNLDPGTYWLDWTTDGELSSGPWAPPVTILGQTTTGNALQYTSDSSSWAPANDSGTLTQQDMPFIIMGPAASSCELFIKYREVRSEKLFKKPQRRRLIITGSEDFDIFGEIDLGPIAWQKVKFNTKKNKLKISAIFPFGLEPGFYPISIGDCSGEIEVTGFVPPIP